MLKLLITYCKYSIYSHVCLTMITQLKNYCMAKVDAKGACIQTELSGSPVYMILDNW
jgi:hypothetical protein